MKLSISSIMLTICLSSVPFSLCGAAEPSEENCRKAIAAGLEQLRIIPPDLAKRDDEDRKKLLAELEHLVAINRSKGVSECEIWTQLMGKAFNQ